MEPAAPELDFDRFHREDLPRLLASGNGALAARGAERLRSLAFRLTGGAAYTYVPSGGGDRRGTRRRTADTVIELAPELWRNS